MKKSIIAFAVISVLSLGAAHLYAWGWGPGGGCAWGPGRGYGHGHGFGNIYAMEEYLGLSEVQMNKIAKIDSEYRYELYKNRNNLDKIEALRTEYRNAVNKVLTKTQREKWEDLYKIRNSRGFGYHHWGWR